MQEEYHTRCHDCGRFLPKSEWVPKNHKWKQWALCRPCRDQYDDGDI